MVSKMYGNAVIRVQQYDLTQTELKGFVTMLVTHIYENI